MIKAIIFDLDGTLLDTLTSIGNSFNRALLEMGMPIHDIQDYRHFVGDGVFKCAERCLPVEKRSDITINQLADLERQDYAQTWQLHTQPYQGILDLLEAAEKAGFQLAVLSNKDETFTRQCIQYFFPATNWAVIVGHSKEVPYKPDPTGAYLIAKQLRLEPQELAIVGDTGIDIATARACNMFCVGVLWGFRESAELEDAGANRIIEHPDQLLGNLKTDTSICP
ncbi:MAG: HAD family hydrolase [Gammaproteobacteria bacterium]|nr:HAD family hydrolase [Gammaproteobacteria bacterium]